MRSRKAHLWLRVLRKWLRPLPTSYSSFKPWIHRTPAPISLGVLACRYSRRGEIILPFHFSLDFPDFLSEERKKDMSARLASLRAVQILALAVLCSGLTARAAGP